MIITTTMIILTIRQMIIDLSTCLKVTDRLMSCLICSYRFFCFFFLKLL